MMKITISSQNQAIDWITRYQTVLKSFFTVFLLLCSLGVFGQILIPNTTAVTQNFDGMGTTLNLPANWKMHASTVSPTWSGGVSTVTQQASSGTPGAGGTYNFGSSVTERAVGAMTSGSFGSPNNLLAFFQNTNASNLTSLTVSYDAERYRINIADASVQFFYSLNGTTWTAVPTGDIPTTSFPTGSNTYNFPTVTVINKTGISITGLNIPTSGSIYLRWNINTVGANSQGIAIDNINAKAGFAIASVQTGNWDNVLTWAGGVVPTSADDVVISTGQVVTMNTTTGGINTRDVGTTTTVNTGGTLATDVAYTNNGTTIINGSFQLNSGGWTTGNNLAYNPTGGTLIFNKTGFAYGVNSGDVFWPTTDTIAPLNVTILQGGMTLNSGANRTVTGTFQTAAGVTLSSATLTLNGTAQINGGGYFNNSPIYGSTSTLIYNNGGTFSRGNEWTTATSGAGHPANVQVSKLGTIIDMGATTAQCSGNLLIDASARLNVTTAVLTVLGNVTTNGTIYLGGDVTTQGNWTVGASGSQLNNGKGVFFTKASGNQIIAKTAGGTVFFDYLIINKAAGNVQFGSSPATSVVINTATGGAGVLQLLNAGNLDLNGNSLTFNNDLGDIQVNAAGRTITSTATGATLNITGNKFVTGAGTLNIGANVTTVLSKGLDFGSGKTTINGTLQINPNGFANNNSPIYGSNSTLVYNGVATYGVGYEWTGNATTAGNGTPQNVTLTTSSVNMPGSARSLVGNLTIGIGSALNLNGTFGSDLSIGGNWSKVGTGAFTANNSAVFFRGTAAQTLSGATNFDYLIMNNNGGLALQTSSSIAINKGLTLTTGSITIGANNITIPASFAISGGSVASHIIANSSGKVIRTVLGSTSRVFPVGLSATKYSPITLQNTTGTSDVSVNLSNTFTGAVTDATKVVNLQWNVSSSAATTATISPTWELADQGASMVNPGLGEVGNYQGGSYVIYPAALSMYNTTVSGLSLVSGVNPIVVGNEDAIFTNPVAYFRSNVVSGLWATRSSWQYSMNNVIWKTSPLAPTSNALAITIRNGHKITISTSGVSMTKTTVESGGILEISTPSTFAVSGAVAGDINLTVEGGGFLSVTGKGYASGNSKGLIKTGGSISADMGSDNSDFLQYYIGRSADAFFKFENQSICEWNLNNYPTSNSGGNTDRYNLFISKNTGDLPIFRINSIPVGQAYGNSNNNNIINAILELNTSTPFNINNATNEKNIYFIGGIRGNGSFVQNITPAGPGIIILGDASHVPELGGNILIKIRSNRLELPNGANITSGANVIIERNDSTLENGLIDRQGGVLTVDGTLDISNMRITNTASGGIIVNGILRTANSGGLNGSGSAIVDGILTLNDNSTIDYYATANQTISSAPSYYNLTFSGAGTKTPQNATNVNTNGTVKITGTPIVDFTNFNLASVLANDTKFIMDGGKFIVGTGDTQPRPGGNYAITGGAIEFTGNSVTDIRVTPDYYNVIISGDNKKPGGKDFKINNIFTVTSAGKFTIPEETDTLTPYVVTAKKGIQVITGGKALFLNNANLIQDVDAINSGNINVQRKANVPSTQYNYWSSPVIGQKLYSLYDVPDNTVMTYNSWNDKFTILPKVGDPTSVFAKGYSIKGSPTLPSPLIAEFVGTPNNETSMGINSIPLSTAGSNYNLIGNPFPSNLNLLSLYGDAGNTNKFYNVTTGPDIETPTAYFWDNTSNGDLVQIGSTYAQNNYAVLNLSSGVGTSAPRFGTTGKKPNGIVKPGQGFIIRAAETGGNLTFKNSFRTTSVGTAGTYFKNGGETTDKFWINLTTLNNMNIVIALAYNPEAEDSFERFDSAIISDVVSENLYSLSSDSKKLAIQSRKGYFIDTDKISLGIKTSIAGTQKISIDEKLGVFENQPIYLKDNLLNIITDLSASTYEFTSSPGVDHNRFEIVFKPSGTLVTTNQQKGILEVYRSGEYFVVKSNDVKIAEVEVYDAVGRLYQKVKGGAVEVKIDAAPLTSGLYVLKIKINNETISKKIIK